MLRGCDGIALNSMRHGGPGDSKAACISDRNFRQPRISELQSGRKCIGRGVVVLQFVARQYN